MAYENYTIRQFESAWFRGNRSVMDEDTFNEVYTEYVDTARLFEQDQFEKSAYIEFLNGKINSINLNIKLQKDFIEEFKVPFKPSFKIFEKYGYFLVWNEDIKDFIEQLNRIELFERKNVTLLEKSIKELKDTKKGAQTTLKQTHASFLRTVNSLGKCGFIIDKDKTTVEELAHMINQQVEENENIKSNY